MNRNDNDIYQKMDQYDIWEQKIVKQILFITKKIREGNPETALMQFQIVLRTGLKMQPSDNIINLVKNIDEKIVMFHKDCVSIEELAHYIWKFEGNFLKEVGDEHDRLMRLNNLYEKVEEMIENGDSLPSFVLSEKFEMVKN